MLIDTLPDFFFQKQNSTTLILIVQAINHSMEAHHGYVCIIKDRLHGGLGVAKNGKTVV